MTRALRTTVPEGIYHVTSRGNGDEMIFASDKDKHVLLRLLDHVATDESWKIMAYCAMGNHYHFVVQTLRENLSEGMQMLNTSYGESYNERHGHRGHVFQGRFFSVLFASDPHLLEACRYTVLNPVRAGLVADVGEWQWSSYAASAYGKHGPVTMADEMLLSMMDARGIDESRRAYRDFIGGGIGLSKPSFLKRRPRGRPSTCQKEPSDHAHLLSGDELATEMRQLYAGGHTVRSIAELLGVSPMTVSRRLRQSESEDTR